MNQQTPEYSGFNTKIAREQGQGVKPKTLTIFTPLIDSKPSDPTTIKTAMMEGQRITIASGQKITVFTTDQQLYRISLFVLWNQPSLALDFVLRLGGMHLLMTFVGSVGTLMANSGLDTPHKPNS